MTNPVFNEFPVKEALETARAWGQANFDRLKESGATLYGATAEDLFNNTTIRAAQILLAADPEISKDTVAASSLGFLLSTVENPEEKFGKKVVDLCTRLIASDGAKSVEEFKSLMDQDLARIILAYATASTEAMARYKTELKPEEKAELKQFRDVYLSVLEPIANSQALVDGLDASFKALDKAAAAPKAPKPPTP